MLFTKKDGSMYYIKAETLIFGKQNDVKQSREMFVTTSIEN